MCICLYSQHPHCFDWVAAVPSLVTLLQQCGAVLLLLLLRCFRVKVVNKIIDMRHQLKCEANKTSAPSPYCLTNWSGRGLRPTDLEVLSDAVFVFPNLAVSKGQRSLTFCQVAAPDGFRLLFAGSEHREACWTTACLGSLADPRAPGAASPSEDTSLPVSSLSTVMESDGHVRSFSAEVVCHGVS